MPFSLLHWHFIQLNKITIVVFFLFSQLIQAEQSRLPHYLPTMFRLINNNS